MASLIRLKHPQTGIVRDGFTGFSWTSFFFGGFPALLRGEWLHGLAILAGGIVFGSVSFGLLWFLVSLVWAMVYNKQYTHRLLQAGYVFDDAPERVAHAKRALGVE